MQNLSSFLNGFEFIKLTDIVLVANIIIAVLVAVGEYRRRKAQNKADEGGAISSIANAAARVSESSLGLLDAKDDEITEKDAEIRRLEEQIKLYRALLKEHNITDQYKYYK